MSMISDPILLVEHDTELCHLIEETLENAGYAVETVQTGRNALHESKHRRFCVAIVAAQLADADGTELYQQIKANQPNINAILLTPGGSVERLRKGIDAGFADVIGTPLNPGRLLTSIDMVID